METSMNNDNNKRIAEILKNRTPNINIQINMQFDANNTILTVDEIDVSVDASNKNTFEALFSALGTRLDQFADDPDLYVENKNEELDNFIHCLTK